MDQGLDCCSCASCSSSNGPGSQWDLKPPLVPLINSGNSLQIAEAQNHRMVIQLELTPVFNEQLRCGRSTVSVAGSPFVGTLRADIYVDDRLDPNAICTTLGQDCESFDLTEAPTEIDYCARHTSAQS